MYIKACKEYRIAGRGNHEKRTLFKQWAAGQFRRDAKLVYAFFDRYGESLYVGRTKCGSRRPLSLFDRHWISQASYILIYEARNNRQLYLLQGLMSDYYTSCQLVLS